MDTNVIDIILGMLLILAAIQGFRKGFIVEASSLLTLIIGLWASINYFEVVGEMLVDDLGISIQYVNIVSFVLIFVSILIIVFVVARVVTMIVKVMALGFFNRLAGLLLSAVKFAVLMSFILFYFDQVDENFHIIPEDVKAESKLYRPILLVTPSILPFINDWSDHLINQIQIKDEPNSLNR